MKSYKYDIFLSYSLEDKNQAEVLAKELQNRDLRVWFDAWNLTVWAIWIR
jgi:hypothetical protein